MQANDTVKTSEETVSCDGGGTLGHPKVYLEIKHDHEATCPYCGKVFVYNRIG